MGAAWQYPGRGRGRQERRKKLTTPTCWPPGLRRGWVPVSSSGLKHDFPRQEAIRPNTGRAPSSVSPQLPELPVTTLSKARSHKYSLKGINPLITAEPNGFVMRPLPTRNVALFPFATALIKTALTPPCPPACLNFRNVFPDQKPLFLENLQL